MKKLYFFTMLSIMLLAVTGAMAQKKTKFKPADLKIGRNFNIRGSSYAIS